MPMDNVSFITPATSCAHVLSRNEAATSSVFIPSSTDVFHPDIRSLTVILSSCPYLSRAWTRRFILNSCSFNLAAVMIIGQFPIQRSAYFTMSDIPNVTLIQSRAADSILTSAIIQAVHETGANIQWQQLCAEHELDN